MTRLREALEKASQSDRPASRLSRPPARRSARTPPSWSRTRGTSMAVEERCQSPTDQPAAAAGDAALPCSRRGAGFRRRPSARAGKGKRDHRCLGDLPVRHRGVDRRSSSA